VVLLTAASETEAMSPSGGVNLDAGSSPESLLDRDSELI
jgi:hypothetical protein